AMRLALTYPLTCLGNHRHFHERLQRELLNAEEQRTALTLCFVDIDDFKKINDRFGHPSGDRVLSQVAGRLRQGGEAFRLGGDEFALLLSDHDEGMAHGAGRYRAAASLAKAVDGRDTYAGRHSERVSELAAQVARRLGLDPEQVELTRLAGSLHDLGKLAIPEEILRKPGTLTDSERLV